MCWPCPTLTIVAKHYGEGIWCIWLKEKEGLVKVYFIKSSIKDECRRIKIDEKEDGLFLSTFMSFSHRDLAFIQRCIFTFVNVSSAFMNVQYKQWTYNSPNPKVTWGFLSFIITWISVCFEFLCAQICCFSSKSNCRKENFTCTKIT